MTEVELDVIARADYAEQWLQWQLELLYLINEKLLLLLFAKFLSWFVNLLIGSFLIFSFQSLKYFLEAEKSKFQQF